MKNIVVKSIVVLSAICLCTSLLLAVTNQITAPIIEESDRQATNASLAEVMPGCSDFEELEFNTASVECLEKVWKCSDGYVMKLSATGYAPGIIIMIGIKNDGTISKVKTMACNETAGYGKQCEDAWYQEQYAGKDASLSGVDAISGATKTSNGYRTAIQNAFKAFDLLTGEAAK